MKVMIATLNDFGSTAAERISGGKVGTLYIDKDSKDLKMIFTDGNAYTAKSGGTAVAFVAD